DSLAAPVRSSLTRFLDAVLELQTTATSPKAVAPILIARNHFLDAIVGLDRALRTAGPVAAGLCVQIVPAIAIDLSCGDTTYRKDLALVLGTGGNDTYLNNAGGAP